MSNFANFEDWRENEPWSDDGDDYDDDDVGYEEDDAGNVVRVGQERKNKQTSDDHSRVDLMAKYRCVLLWARPGSFLKFSLSDVSISQGSGERGEV